MIMKSLFLFTLVSVLTLGASLNAQQSLIAGWDFDTSPPGTDLGPFQSDLQNMPKVYIANSGSGTLYADGTNGSSNWLRQGELTNPADSASRQLSVMAGESGRGLAFRQPEAAVDTENDARGQSIVFAFSMETYASVDITFDFRRSSGQTFADLLWETSVDALTWTPVQTLTYSGVQNDWPSEDRLNTITGLADASTAYIRVTFDDASGNPGGDRAFIFDNIEFNATPIPEPAHIAAIFGVIILVGIAWSRRRNCR